MTPIKSIETIETVRIGIEDEHCATHRNKGGQRNPKYLQCDFRKSLLASVLYLAESLLTVVVNQLVKQQLVLGTIQ